MGYLGGADAEGERPKRAVRRGVTSSDCIRLTWLGAALLLATPAADVMLPLMAEHGATWTMSPPGLAREYLSHPAFDDAVAPVAETKQRDAVLACVIRQRADHLAAIWL